MTTEDKALALLNDVRTERGFAPVGGLYGSALLGEALCRAIEQIEQHEAFRQEVSDIVYAHVHVTRTDDWEKLKTLIIPKPKTDPLVDAMDKLEWCNTDALAKDLRDTLDALGFEIREKNDD